MFKIQNRRAQALLSAFLTSVQEGFGHPATLYAWLKDYPGFSTPLGDLEPDIALGSVVKWHEWGESSAYHCASSNHGEVMGWRNVGGVYSSFSVKREEFLSFGSCRTFDRWECEIQDVIGLSASKSILKDFVSLDRMVKTNSPRMVEPISEVKLRENLAWKEIRILHRDDSSDFFVRHLWDGRVFLANCGGSHHFAAARYLAARLKMRVPLRGRLYAYAINERAVAGLQRDYEMFVVADDPKVLFGLYEAMRSFRATYLWKCLPRPIEDRRVILLPRSDARSMRVATVLREAGFFDLGLYLRGLSARQARTRNRYTLNNVGWTTSH